jgi:hypothetical protein
MNIYRKEVIKAFEDGRSGVTIVHKQKRDSERLSEWCARCYQWHPENYTGKHLDS